MKNGYTVLQLILTIVVLFLVIFFLIFGVNNLKKKKYLEKYKEIEAEDAIIINGSYLTYIEKGDKFIELGAKIYDKFGNVKKDKIDITYFRGNEQVFSIDSRFADEFLVKYNYNDLIATRVVIVRK